ncbi:MAG: LLM class F420-dependent oxidoreductase [Alphaproteobacteria bacterium]
MDIGVFFFPTHYSIALTELAVELEQRGFESLLTCEYTHIPASRKTPFPGGEEVPKQYYHTYDPFVGLAFAAAVTKTLRIGTGICLVPQHDPFNLAKSVASVDRLPGGRFNFGIGGGWNVDEMENHGVNYKTRFKVMRETILAAKQLWIEETGEYHGEFVDFDPAFCSPKPLQTPHPPILLGGESDHTLRRIVEYCDGWFPRGPIDMVDGFARLGRIAEEAGRDMATLSATVFNAEPDAAALQKYRDAGVNRVLLQMPSEDRDRCLKTLDSYMPLLG